MEDTSGASSEKELLELRNEGKITEDEYQDLLAAMQRKSSPELDARPNETSGSEAKSKLGLIAFIVMLTGIILPALVVHFGQKGLNTATFFFPGLAIEIGALVMGIIAWKD